jgi:hypothetical protein
MKDENQPRALHPLSITISTTIRKFMSLMDLTHFICKLPSESDQEADLKYTQAMKIKK